MGMIIEVMERVKEEEIILEALMIMLSIVLV